MVVVCFEGYDCTDRETAFSEEIAQIGATSFADDLTYEMDLVTTYYEQQSFGKTTLEITEVPGLITLPPTSPITKDFCEHDSSGNGLDHLGSIFDEIMALVETSNPDVGPTGDYDYPLIISPGCASGEWAGEYLCHREHIISKRATFADNKVMTGSILTTAH